MGIVDRGIFSRVTGQLSYVVGKGNLGALCGPLRTTPYDCL